MKKLLLVFALTLPVAGVFATPQLAAAELTANSAAPAIMVPAGFMTIDNEAIESIELEPGTDNVLFKGKGSGKPGKVAKGNPRGRQGGHMPILSDYQVAGLAEGNVVFFDDATSTLFITEVTEEQIIIVKQTAVTVN